MLAYLFWHWPKLEVETGAYEQSLGLFYEALASVALDGFYGSVTLRVEGVPWAGLEPRVYEDWYLLEGSFALDPLNEAAVSGNRQEPHDRAARAAAGGAGGLYRLESGEPAVAESHVATWLTNHQAPATRTSTLTSSPGRAGRERASGGARWSSVRRPSFAYSDQTSSSYPRAWSRSP